MPLKTNEEIVEEAANRFFRTSLNDDDMNWLRTLLTEKDKEREEAVREVFGHFSWCQECAEGPACRDALAIVEKYTVTLTPPLTR